MDQFNVWWGIGLAVMLVVGPAGGVWVGIRGAVVRMEQRFTDFLAQNLKDRQEDREWLKALQTETSQNTTEIARLHERTGGTVGGG